MATETVELQAYQVFVQDGHAHGNVYEVKEAEKTGRPILEIPGALPNQTARIAGSFLITAVHKSAEEVGKDLETWMCEPQTGMYRDLANYVPSFVHALLSSEFREQFPIQASEVNAQIQLVAAVIREYVYGIKTRNTPFESVRDYESTVKPIYSGSWQWN